MNDIKVNLDQTQARHVASLKPGDKVEIVIIEKEEKDATRP